MAKFLWAWTSFVTCSWRELLRLSCFQ